MKRASKVLILGWFWLAVAAVAYSLAIVACGGGR